MSVADDYFARVRPLLGRGLSDFVVEVDDADVGLLVIELLASCMLEHVVVQRGADALARYISWKQPFAPLRTTLSHRVDARIIARRPAASNLATSNLALSNPATSDLATSILGASNVATSNPATSNLAGASAVSIEWRDREVTMTVDPDDTLAWFDVSYHVARVVRDALLGRVAWPTASSSTATGEPLARRPQPLARRQPFDPRGIAIDLRGCHVVIVGCGSLGSEALRILASSGARFTLIDDAHVTVYNLARQWFGAADIGRLKVDALRDRLAMPSHRTGFGDTSGSVDESRADGRGSRTDTRVWAARLDAGDLPAFESLVRDDPPDLVILATGTHHHAMLAELLWRLAIPHVAACCYPQARYFEVSVISPREQTPCLHCFRGHLYRGPAEPPPMTDEVAAFLYQPSTEDERAQRYTDLVAEPASKIETLRAAHVLARCAVELCSPTRSPWFARLLAESTTCLLGGNVAGAYGITEPGQVLRLGTDDIIGSSDSVSCDVCGRELRVSLRDELPAITDDLADAALR